MVVNMKKLCARCFACARACVLSSASASASAPASTSTYSVHDRDRDCDCDCDCDLVSADVLFFLLFF